MGHRSNRLDLTRGEFVVLVFTEAELNNPVNCRRNDIFIAQVVSDRKVGPKGVASGVRITRDCEPTSFYGDGTYGVSATEMDDAADEYDHRPCKSLGGETATAWLWAKVRPDGSFQRWPTVEELGMLGPFNRQDDGHIMMED